MRNREHLALVKKGREEHAEDTAAESSRPAKSVSLTEGRGTSRLGSDSSGPHGRSASLLPSVSGTESGPEPCRVADPDGKPQQLPSPTASVAAPRPLGASGPEPFFCHDPFGLWIESILEDKDA